MCYLPDISVPTYSADKYWTTFERHAPYAAYGRGGIDDGRTTNSVALPRRLAGIFREFRGPDRVAARVLRGRRARRALLRRPRAPDPQSPRWRLGWEDGCFPECDGGGLRPPPFGPLRSAGLQRVDTVHERQPCDAGALASIRQRHYLGAPEAHPSGAPVDLVAQRPMPRARGRDFQPQAAPVAIPARLRILDLLCCQPLAHVLPYSLTYSWDMAYSEQTRTIANNILQDRPAVIGQPASGIVRHCPLSRISPSGRVSFWAVFLLPVTGSRFALSRAVRARSAQKDYDAKRFGCMPQA